MLQVGIVGLPNVGKSTLFNALLKKQQALAANYPFATIEPNIGIVPVPDVRLEQIARITQEEDKLPSLPPLVPATIQFVDIAGLVKGAATGAGLGNKFLSHIREVDVICEVVRGFSHGDIIREGAMDPKSDREVINTELILADLQTLEKVDIRKDKDEHKLSALSKLRTEMDKGKLASEVNLTDEEAEAVKDLQLLTAKKIMYVLNVSADEQGAFDMKLAVQKLGVGEKQICLIDAKLESEIAAFTSSEQAEYLKSVGVEESGLDKLIRTAYALLGLQSYFTTGEKETRAWTIKIGSKAPQAAAVIHTDFEKGFIRAETVSFNDFVTNGGWKKNRELGKMRLEGRDYIMSEGDVVEFRINA